MRGDDIPLAARILRLADSYAALTDARPYRPAFTAEAATTEIVKRAGIEFDPSVVDAFLVMTPIRELESFAKTELEAIPEIVDEKQEGWGLFS
jgi:HD-GYP domain-containing protein (c-di-GMP phosphodiesterase class II)